MNLAKSRATLEHLRWLRAQVCHTLHTQDNGKTLLCCAEHACNVDRLACAQLCHAWRQRFFLQNARAMDLRMVGGPALMAYACFPFSTGCGHPGTEHGSNGGRSTPRLALSATSGSGIGCPPRCFFEPVQFRQKHFLAIACCAIIVER